jgi:cell division protein FtsI/penicillin-binding protein 2
MDFQEDVDQIVTDIVNERRGLNDSAYAVAMDPNDGSILAMSGKKVDDNGEIQDHTLGTIQNAFEMGSSVKGATILAGYMDGVLTPENNNIVDTPMELAGDSQDISSVFNRSGTEMVNDITALQYSSNVYMARLAMRMGGQYDFEQNEPLQINGPSTIQKMRGYYEQFGLGTETGIDLPSESIGQSPTLPPNQHFQPLFQAFGQYDTYTLMQLAQYSATIANGGTRYAPRLVSEIRETNSETGEIGRLATTVEPKVMNHVNVTDEQMNRVHQGFNLVVNGDYGFAPGIFADAPYQAAGKTGTAEAIYWNPESNEHLSSVTNLSFVGFAPYDDPEIAIAIIIPYLPNEDTGTNHVEMSRQIFDAYFQVGDFADDDEDTENTEE